MKNRKFIYFVLVLFAGWVGTSGASIYTGQISVADGGIAGTAQWANDPSTQLSWTVTLNADQTWRYNYVLTVSRHSISHFIVEVSPTFVVSNLLNPTANQGSFETIEIDIFTDTQGYSNPGMPSEIYGIKFNDTEGTIFDISFDSPRMPVWGDFYAKGGVEAGGIWNSGFAADDPIDVAANGSLNGHILVPNTFVIPEPATMILLGIGGTSILRRKRTTV